MEIFKSVPPKCRFILILINKSMLNHFPINCNLKIYNKTGSRNLNNNSNNLKNNSNNKDKNNNNSKKIKK
jgi:hypothetical protein